VSGRAPGSLNWREIDLVLAELGLEGCLIQEIHQPVHDRLVLHLFRAGSAFMVLVSLAPRLPRMHLLTEKIVNPEKPYRFATFLRARIRGGRIESAVQVRAGNSRPGAEAPGERIVRIAVARGGERAVLWIRLWGSAANAILTDDSGAILDAFYRRPKKGEISGKPYTLPARASPPAAGKEYTIRDLPGPGLFNERLEELFRDAEASGNVERAAAEADAELEMSENKILSNMSKLAARLREYASVERFRELGDLVMAALHTITKGDRWLTTEDFFHGGAPVTIELRPECTPAQNAEAYYERHRKARLGKGSVEEELGRLAATLERIKAQRASLAENPDAATLARAARSAARARTPLQDAGTPGLVFHSPPFRIIVGRTAAENDELLRRKMRGNDWWFHARDWPGAYVFVKSAPGKSLPLETMLDAAMLAVHFSRGKLSGQGDVYYTRVKYLRRAKGGRTGTVLPTQEKNIHVQLDPSRIDWLKAGGETPSG
jgi:predicted ribosome quality control (RQC) complex YloA/Tae2 family protein